MANQLSRDELAQIPEDLHKLIKDASSMWDDFYTCIKYAIRLLAYGPPGTGKSRACSTHNIGHRPLERLSITPETCWPEVRGHYGLGEKGMVWMDGPGIRAWRIGARLVIDEIDQAGGDCIPGLHMLCDDNAVARLTLPNGETLRPSDDFQCFATTNSLPSALPEALCDRFVIKRQIDRPDPRMLFSLPRCIRPAAAYSMYSSDPKAVKMTSRSWVEMGRVMDKDGLNVRDALSLIVGPKKAKDAALAIEVAATKQGKVDMANIASPGAEQPTV